MNNISNYQVTINYETEIVEIEDLNFFVDMISLRSAKTICLIDRNLSLSFPVTSKEAHVLEVESGESIKTIDSVRPLIQLFIDHQIDKSSTIIVVGGGALTDAIGFIASIYLRGIRLIVVPSTLLSMVDAAIGGKNGLNFAQAKNQLGTIYQPEIIAIFPKFLGTLPSVEWTSGFAEIIKYGLIADSDLCLELLDFDLVKIQNDPEKMMAWMTKCIQIKSRIVQQDPTDKTLRKTLNFGHTIGHVLESSYNIPHGHAVGLGMIVAGYISEREFQMDNTIVPMIIRLLNRFEIPTTIEWDISVIANGIKKDKKRANEIIDFILLNKIGEAVIKQLTLTQIEEYLYIAKTEQWIS
jgi:3-dehydroquinate synthase